MVDYEVQILINLSFFSQKKFFELAKKVRILLQTIGSSRTISKTLKNEKPSSSRLPGHARTKKVFSRTKIFFSWKCLSGGNVDFAPKE